MKLDTRMIEKRIVSYYLNSRDYNGLSLSTLIRDIGTNSNNIYEIVMELVKTGKISVVSPHQSNPFIKMFDAPIEEQLDGLKERNPGFVCLYPTPTSVQEEIALSAYDDQPFTKMMILTNPKLLAIPFRLDVLDMYERDPRYRFRFYDFGGTISVRSEYNDHLGEDDQIRLRFGVGHDEEGDRVVAVYLYHLAALPGRQQRIWREFLIHRKCRMYEEFFVTTILGEPAETMSTYDAIIQEQVEINRLFGLMGRQPPLFRETYEDQRRPQGFSFFMKPTKKEYDNFIHLLDKMMSENIDIDAFGEDVERHNLKRISDNEFERQPKGSITMLEEWLSLRYSALPPDERTAVINPLREVRNLRQKPAHMIVADNYDKQFYELQDNLVWNVYSALNGLRHILTQDPSVSQYDPPFWDGRPIVKSY